MTASETIRYGIAPTSVGAILVGASAAGLVAIIIRERADDEELAAILQARFPHAALSHDQRGMQQAVETVAGFIENPSNNITLPLDIRGTEFQRQVWAGVMAVPFAHTTTFAAIAESVGSPRAVRAVGNACSKNPLEFAIPCHRVLRSNGAYSGGSEWGDWRQATIVRREAAALIGESLTQTDRMEKHDV
jgi:AraC family transcriptional regulator, regulatory protein of adaptative response / methylated-DNA-[protein]-cysteine methyltransferase